MRFIKNFILRFFLVCLLFASCISGISCSSNHPASVSSLSMEEEKVSKNDPFKATMVKSEFFEINGNQDTVIEGQKGTRIAIPAHCFKNLKGETVDGPVKFELSEALGLDDMLLSNLTTMAGKNPLETGGMLYLNAHAGPDKLHIDSSKPLYIEVPTHDKKPGMMVYKGTRDEKGNMNWTSPKKMENYLVSVDLALLDFLPKGFKDEVVKGMPFHHHKIATKELVDSFYYSLSVTSSDALGAFPALGAPTDMNESLYNRNAQIKNGKYTSKSYERKMKAIIDRATDAKTDVDPKRGGYIVDHKMHRDTCLPKATDCGIDPAMIKVIKGKKFQNTLISTREFEKRLQYLFKTCNPQTLKLYTANLDKNMWEVDSMVSAILPAKSRKDESRNDSKQIFKAFASEKLTKVAGATPNAKRMAAYFEKRLKSIKKDLEALAEKAQKINDKANEKATEMADQYKDLLWKREKYRMEKYGYQWTDLGWSNIDQPLPAGDYKVILVIKPNKLEATVKDIQGCDQVYSYVVYQSIKSLYRMNSDDKKHFYVGDASDKQMIMRDDESAMVISVGYKNGAPFIGSKSFITGRDENVVIDIAPTTEAELRKNLRQYNNYQTENQIKVDLEYQKFFAKERIRQQKLQEEWVFMNTLRNIAMPCCLETRGNGDQIQISK